MRSGKKDGILMITLWSDSEAKVEEMKREKKRKKMDRDWKDMVVMGLNWIEERTQHNTKALREEKERNWTEERL